jgi:hypothetical protein
MDPINCRPEARALFQRLARQYSTPLAMQTFLRSIPYNEEKSGETLRSAFETYHAWKAHCLEGAFLAAAVLELHGYPPLVMSLESQDDLDHVVYIFRTKGGWGSIGRSRDDGLHGRPPNYRSLRDLAWSYFDPYVDETAKITGYGLANLDDSGTPWRDSHRYVWKAERFLIELKHSPLHSSERRYQTLLRNYREKGDPPHQPGWW